MEDCSQLTRSRWAQTMSAMYKVFHVHVFVRRITPKSSRSLKAWISWALSCVEAMGTRYSVNAGEGHVCSSRQSIYKDYCAAFPLVRREGAQAWHSWLLDRADKSEAEMPMVWEEASGVGCMTSSCILLSLCSPGSSQRIHLPRGAVSQLRLCLP